MSRSKHITRKEALQRFAEGELEAAAEYRVKRVLKVEYKKHREYTRQSESAGSLSPVPNSAFLSVLKRFLKGEK
jgi:hypothetical protein